MFLVKKSQVKLRRHHEILGTGAAVSLTVHGWANLITRGMPCLFWMGWDFGLSRVFGTTR